MANILGLSFFFHDSAAALVCDGKVIAAAAEERFCRRKHTSEFPKMAIEYCLDAGDFSSINDLDAIVFYEKPVLKLFRAVEIMVVTWPRSYKTFVTKLPKLLSSKVNIYKIIYDHLPGYKGEILFSEHHLSHAASAFYCSPFDEAAILTIDGVGEWETATVGYGKGRKIELKQSIHFPHSVGLLYSAITGYLGFKVNDGEWKVMGLAPYGEPKYAEQLRELVSVKADGSFNLNLKYFAHQYSSQWTSNLGEWEKLLGFPRRDPKAPMEQCHEDLARSAQVVVEEIILNLARSARSQYASENLVVAGGVGLNSVANWRIEKEGIFKNVWIQPAAGDDGGALGAALIVSQNAFQDAPSPEMRNTYLGPNYTESEIQDFLESRQIPSERFDNEMVVDVTADLIAQNKVVGWFQGSMEFGPRSLGSRSILANPTNSNMKETINKKIKFREYFRPFAPSVAAEHVHEYFDVPKDTDMPFMLKVPTVRLDKKHLIPAVTHEDGTGRVQTVRKSDSPIFYQLLESLGRRIGVPVVLNTSFNVRGEPIVCSPQDAYDCFIRTDIDALVLGNFIVTVKPSRLLDLDQSYARSDALESSNDERDQELRSKKTIFSTQSNNGNRADFLATSRKVLNFYKELPFNYYSNSIDTTIELLKANRIKSYPVLHRYLSKLKGGRVLDVGCGSGWFVNSCSYFYHLQTVGIEVNPVVLKQARAVQRLFPSPIRAEFVQSDLFQFKTTKPFEVVNSLGVLHHTPECHVAIKKCLDYVKEGGYFHLGLYHRYGRKPFLDYFRKLRESGVSDADLYQEFANLNPDISDETHMISWFRDQVIHPHETQHTYVEIAQLLEREGFQIEATSINKYKQNPEIDQIHELEKKMEDRSRRALYKQKRYFPGFFTIWARKVERKQVKKILNSREVIEQPKYRLMED